MSVAAAVQLSAAAIFKTAPFVLTPAHHALLGLHGVAEAAAEEAASTLSLFKNVDEEKPSRPAGTHVSSKQPRTVQCQVYTTWLGSACYALHNPPGA
jgi:hypothetical protein